MSLEPTQCLNQAIIANVVFSTLILVRLIAGKRLHSLELCLPFSHTVALLYYFREWSASLMAVLHFHPLLLHLCILPPIQANRSGQVWTPLLSQELQVLGLLIFYPACFSYALAITYCVTQGLVAQWTLKLSHFALKPPSFLMIPSVKRPFSFSSLLQRLSKTFCC